MVTVGRNALTSRYPLCGAALWEPGFGPDGEKTTSHLPQTCTPYILYVFEYPLSSLFLLKTLSPSHRCSIKVAKLVVAAAEMAMFVLAMSKERDRAFQTTGTVAVIAYQLCAFSCYRSR